MNLIEWLYIVGLSATIFLSAITIWSLYFYLAIEYKFDIIPTKLELSKNIFSYQSNYSFSILVFLLSIILGLLFAWTVSKKIIYKISNKINASNMTSNMEVWDDFFGVLREDSFVVVRDVNSNLMYYGQVVYYSISATSKTPALYLKDVDVFINESSEKLYNVKELYLPFKNNTMTVEFPNFKEGTK